MKQAVKPIAVWLDHSKAHFIGLQDGHPRILETVESAYERKPRIEGEGSDVTRFGKNVVSNNEDRKHNRLQNELDRYYRELEYRLMQYTDILLFGPTNAKEQLKNRLAENKSFAQKSLLIESVGTLTDNQILAFARDFLNARSVKEH
ncbi:MAG: hypothetical protein KatS3mg031_1957 [Chitinophagales bacterium]|nr:MAG: hypothetical protein KatS3mg031_1957 [Chitinophagales bacterium]